MRFRDTLSGEVKEFTPIAEGRVNIFVCGPTVYDYIQLGNARTFVFFDMFVKYLRAIGYEVFYLQNITDLDDKTLTRAKEEKKEWDEVSNFYYKAYLDDCKSLDIDSVSHHARATLYLEEIKSQILRLIKLGYAYASSDGVYFDTSKFRDYGKLSKQNLDQIIMGARVEIRASKKNPQDFVLWKLADDKPNWNSPWGSGRPGWHIEDTAITEHFFGPEYDVHGGGTDLIFPHHEAEIAQMRSISGSKFLSKYWIHGAFLNFKGEKMSKSTGNVVKVRDLVKSSPGSAVRYFLLNSNYSSEMLYTDEVFQSSVEGWKRLQKAFSIANSFHKCTEECRIEKDSADIIAFMDDDLKTREIIASLHDIASEIFKGKVAEKQMITYVHKFRFANKFLGIFSEQATNLGQIMGPLLQVRKELREMGLYKESDMIRSKLKDAGIVIEDKSGETTWSIGG